MNIAGQKLKIGLVTGEYPPMQGGVGAFTQELGQALAQQGHEIHIITSAAARPEQKRQPIDGLWGLVEHMEARQDPFNLPFAKLHPQTKRWWWGDVRTVAEITARYAFDVVNIQYQPAAYNMNSPAVQFLPWRLKGLTTPVVTFHDLRVPYLFPKAGWVRQWVVQFMARQMGGGIATNPADLANLSQQTTRPVREIPIGSNIHVYQPNPIELQEVRDSFKLQPDDVLLGYFGFLNESKGADILLKALAQLGKKYHLVFIGGRTGSSDPTNNQIFWTQLDQLIRAYHLEKRVFWTGYISDVRVSTHLQAVDLMVMPYKDGVSLRRGTLMAALAHGRPLLTTQPAHPVSEIVHGENSWLVPVNDVEAVSAGVKFLMQQPELRQKLGQGGAEIAQQFSWEKIAQKTAAFFEELLHHKK